LRPFLEHSIGTNAIVEMHCYKNGNIIVGAPCYKSGVIVGSQDTSDHIIATVTFNTIVVFVIPFELERLSPQFF
jgi:hypothetical protein